MSGGWSLRVLVVINHALFRETVRLVLTADARFVLVAEAGSGEEAVAVAEQLALDLALIDMRLPGMNGLATAARLKAAQPQLIVLLLSGEWSAAYEHRAKAAGVTARLAKQTFSLGGLYRALASTDSPSSIV